MKKAFRIIGAVLMACALIPMGLAWWGYRSASSFIRQARHVQAVVSAVDEKRDADGDAYYYPEYRYFDADGNEHVIHSSTGYGRNQVSAGDRVWFYYSIDDPDIARRDSFASLWLLPLLSAIGGALPFLLGLFSLVVLPLLVKDIAPLSSPAVVGKAQPGSAQPVRLSPQRGRTWAMVSHLSSLCMLCGVPFGNVFGPLTVWLIHRDGSALVNEHGRESVNFQLSVLLYSLVLAITIVGILLLPVLGIYGIIQVIRASVRANRGEIFRYPLTIRFIAGNKPADFAQQPDANNG